ncbi:MAG: TonB-dependent siderophore receptor [Novosphingobium sp.]|nr:TonB-dependent siderophore receptor [Novosphingobium sp.]
MLRTTTARRALLGGLAIAVPCSPAWAAEDESAAPIVVTGERQGYAIGDGSTATKTPTALIDVPQSVTVVTRQQLDDQATQQLGDALRYVPGVTLGTGEGHRDQITLRGQSTTADFYLDGLRDDAQYYRPLYNIERVEVLKGANAMIFGRGGGGGVVNRVSKAADPTRHFVIGNASADSFGAFDFAADANLPLGESAAARLNAIYEEFDNHRDFFEGRFFGISPTLTAALGEATRLTAQYTYDDDKRVTDRGVPSRGGRPIRGFDEVFFGSRELNHNTNKAHTARIRLDHEVSPNLAFNVTGQFSDFDKFYANVYPRAAATATTVELEGYADGTKRQNWIGQANLVWTGSTGPIGHTLLAGVEAADQDTDNSRRNVLFAGGTSGGRRFTTLLADRIAVPATSLTNFVTDRRAKLDVRSAYIQDQVSIGEHLQLVAGIRYDDFRLASLNRVDGFAARRSDGKWSPRVGAIVKPQQNISIYGSYARSFLPQSGDQFAVLDATTATLAPERFENIEAGIKWDLRPHLAFTAALFQLDRDNTRANDPVSGLAVLTGSTRTKGVEAQLAGQITPQWQASLGFVAQEGEIRSTTTAAPAGRKLAQLPKFQASAWTRYDVTPEIGFGLGVVHQARQFATISNAVVLPAFTRVDAAAFWDVTPRIAFQLNVENLFDTDYYPSAHTDNNIAPGEPISARVGVRVKF